jgi:putative hydrolase of the HAD superfamily
MVKLYIFDMGGVVSRNSNPAPAMAAHLEFDGATMIEYGREDFEELTTGKISPAEFARRFSRKSGKPIDEQLLSRYFKPELDPEVVAIVESLKNGARIVAGTNTIGPHYDVHLRRGDYDIFHAVYASHIMGLAKPDPAFYTYILEHENCPPGRAVFVDDLPANVEAAGSLGIHSVLYKDAEKLKRDLVGRA